MSYDIRLTDPVTKETLHLDTCHQMAGGIYAIGGTDEAYLNITYNYARWYYKPGVFPDKGEESGGIRSIYGLSGADSIPVLQNAISFLGSTAEDLSTEEALCYVKSGATGYWMPTKANAIRPLYQLLALAKIRPDGVWDGD